MISGDDGSRSSFKGSEWKSTASQLRVGAIVDYEVDGGAASTVYAVPGRHGTNMEYSDEKSHLVAGLLALFLGGFGVHKFYMGYNREGTILLVSTLVSWVLVFVIIGFLGLLAVAIVSLVEAVIYLSAGQTQFRVTYLENHRSWF